MKPFSGDLMRFAALVNASIVEIIEIIRSFGLDRKLSSQQVSMCLPLGSLMTNAIRLIIASLSGAEDKTAVTIDSEAYPLERLRDNGNFLFDIVIKCSFCSSSSQFSLILSLKAVG